MQSIPSLFELAVFKLLKISKKSGRYTETFDDAKPYLKGEMHKCAKKYYTVFARRDREMNLEVNIPDDDEVLYYILGDFDYYVRSEMSTRCSICIYAFIDRNYAFIATELDLLNENDDENENPFDVTDEDKYDKNAPIIFCDEKFRDRLNSDSEVVVVQSIAIATLLYYRRYYQCLSSLKYGGDSWCNNALSVIKLTDEREFGAFVWDTYRERILEGFKKYTDDEWLCVCLIQHIADLHIKNAIENDAWTELHEFKDCLLLNNGKQTFWSQFSAKIETHFERILSDANDLKFFRLPNFKQTLKKMRQNAVKLADFSEIYFGKNIKFGNFEECFIPKSK